MAEVIEIDKVPYTGFMTTGSPYNPRTVLNPLTREFTFSWNGKEYKIKAGGTGNYPEFMVLHAARAIAKEYFAEKNAPADPKENKILYTEKQIREFMQEIVDVPAVEEVRPVGRPSVPKTKAKIKPLKKVVVEEAPVDTTESIEEDHLVEDETAVEESTPIVGDIADIVDMDDPTEE